MNDTPMSNRTHIAFFGKRNAGKSSVVNAITGQSLAIVSDVKGTTTDPVFKTMELLPLGPVVIIDTPGLDDEGELGELRIKKSYEVLAKTDIAVVVIDSSIGITNEDMDIINRISEYEIPFVVVYNKADLDENNIPELKVKGVKEGQVKTAVVSCKTREGIEQLKNTIGSFNKDDGKPLLADIVHKGDFVVLIVPIDSAAPKGRVILPQQMVLRELLDIGATSIVVKETEYKDTLERLGTKPSLVITDSQAFKEVAALTPRDIPLTSFSIILARAKGNFEYVIKSAKVIDELEDNDIVLISEGCTHHRQCDDIGTVKLPNWIRTRTGKDVKFEFTSGREFPDNLDKYRLIIHCGGCMLNDKEIKYRQNRASKAGKAMTNYGTAIAYMNGILERSVEMYD